MCPWACACVRVCVRACVRKVHVRQCWQDKTCVALLAATAKEPSPLTIGIMVSTGRFFDTSFPKTLFSKPPANSGAADTHGHTHYNGMAPRTQCTIRMGKKTTYRSP